MKPINNLLSRLDGNRNMGSGQHYAKCPAHDDKSPSLSIRDTGDTILIHCHAGCRPEDVLAAIGMSFKDLYPGKWKAAYQAAIATAGHEAEKRCKYDPLDHERLILDVAQAKIRNGESLRLDDRARVELALARLGIEEVA